MNKAKCLSAEGARYDSQGQARAKRSASPLDHKKTDDRALKGRNTPASISAFQALRRTFLINQGRRASRLPWLLYFAPLALVPTLRQAAILLLQREFTILFDA
jgi:hypothetical protein